MGHGATARFHHIVCQVAALLAAGGLAVRSQRKSRSLQCHCLTETCKGSRLLLSVFLFPESYWICQLRAPASAATSSSSRTITPSGWLCRFGIHGYLGNSGQRSGPANQANQAVGHRPSVEICQVLAVTENLFCRTGRERMLHSSFEVSLGVLKMDSPVPFTLAACHAESLASFPGLMVSNRFG